MIVPPGYTAPVTFRAGGTPYGVTVTASGGEIPQPVQEAIRHQARRLVEFAAKIAGLSLVARVARHLPDRRGSAADR